MFLEELRFDFFVNVSILMFHVTNIFCDVIICFFFFLNSSQLLADLWILDEYWERYGFFSLPNQSFHRCKAIIRLFVRGGREALYCDDRIFTAIQPTDKRQFHTACVPHFFQSIFSISNEAQPKFLGHSLTFCGEIWALKLPIFKMNHRNKEHNRGKKNYMKSNFQHWQHMASLEPVVLIYSGW